jgi:hypothetical protein
MKTSRTHVTIFRRIAPFAAWTSAAALLVVWGMSGAQETSYVANVPIVIDGDVHACATDKEGKLICFTEDSVISDITYDCKRLEGEKLECIEIASR